jgi:hypothetical protein
MIRINQSSRNQLCAAVVAVCSFTPVTALTLADFNSRLNPGERVTYLTGSVSMLMSNYAAQGNGKRLVASTTGTSNRRRQTDSALNRAVPRNWRKNSPAFRNWTPRITLRKSFWTESTRSVAARPNA